MGRGPLKQGASSAAGAAVEGRRWQAVEAWTVRCLRMDRVCLFVVVGDTGSRFTYGGYGCGYGFIYIGWYLVGILFLVVFWLLVFLAFDFGGKLFLRIFFFFGLHCTHSVKERKTKKSSRRKKGRKGNTQKNIFVGFFLFFLVFFWLHTNIIVID